MHTIKPIAHIRTDFTEKFGIPRQSGRVPELEGKIIFEKEFRDSEALRGIEEFSHLWLIFDFSESHREKWSPTVRPPRLGGNKRVGVFASRSPFRPNSLGISCVKLLRVEKTESSGHMLIVSGVDLLDKTPIYDIKPYIPHSDCKTEAVGGYADGAAAYALKVIFPDPLLILIPEEKRTAAVACLKEDPRPSYQDEPERLYSMSFAGFDIRFTVENGVLTVKAVDKL